MHIAVQVCAGSIMGCFLASKIKYESTEQPLKNANCIPLLIIILVLQWMHIAVQVCAGSIMGCFLASKIKYESTEQPLKNANCWIPLPEICKFLGSKNLHFKAACLIILIWILPSD